MTVDIRSEFFRGTPLIVSISTRQTADIYLIEWQNLSVKVKPDCTAHVCMATVILPTIYEDSGYYTLHISALDNNSTLSLHTENLEIKNKQYTRQTLTVDPKYVALSKKALARVEKERPLLLAAMQAFSGTRMWDMPFMRPLPGKITSQFGRLRMFNGEIRSKHSGIDFAGKAGDTIKAASAGKVVLTGDFYFSGNTVYLDHGQGVVSVYMHMSQIHVKTGDMVSAGDTLGLVGATGRATGPHLHFSLIVQGISVDPTMLFDNQ